MNIFHFVSATTQDQNVPPTGQADCPEGKFFDVCGTACPPTCEDPNPLICTFQCNMDCFCPSGTVLNEANGECVDLADCPQ